MRKQTSIDQKPLLGFSDYLKVLEDSFQEAIDSLWSETELDDTEISILIKDFRNFFNELMETFEEEGVIDSDLVKDYINMYLNNGISALKEIGVDNEILSRFIKFRSLLQEYSSTNLIEA